jgi:hypothetical protein
MLTLLSSDDVLTPMPDLLIQEKNKYSGQMELFLKFQGLTNIGGI